MKTYLLVNEDAFERADAANPVILDLLLHSSDGRAVVFVEDGTVNNTHSLVGCDGWYLESHELENYFELLDTEVNLTDTDLAKVLENTKRVHQDIDSAIQTIVMSVVSDNYSLVGEPVKALVEEALDETYQ